MNFGCAAKALIIKDNSALLIKRRPTDVHKPSQWDIPGGRLEKGEDPYTGLRREAREEVGMDIIIIAPVAVQHFTREDGQQIALTIFLCTTDAKDIELSEEHTEYKWQATDEPLDVFPEWIQKALLIIMERNLLKAI